MNSRPIAMWIGSAFAAGLLLAGLVLATFGAGERGTLIGLQATARLSFVLFWLAYTGSALNQLFGATFQPVKRRGREFGLAFASAHLPHLGLVAWLSYIGDPPARGTFVFFGIAVFWTYLIVLFSIARVQRMLPRKAWSLLLAFGLNYIAYAFAVDFLRHPRLGDISYLIEYLPFAILSVLGPILRLRHSCSASHSCG